MACFVGVGEPVSGAIRSVNLVNQHDISLFVLSKFIFCIHQEQASLRRFSLAELEQREGGSGRLRPICFAHESPVDYFSRAYGFVVILCFCCRCNDVLSEPFVLFHAVREVVPAVGASAIFVMRPQGGVCAAGHEATADEFYGKDRAFLHDTGVGVWCGKECIWNDVLSF